MNFPVENEEFSGNNYGFQVERCDFPSMEKWDFSNEKVWFSIHSYDKEKQNKKVKEKRKYMTFL